MGGLVKVREKNATVDFRCARGSLCFHDKHTQINRGVWENAASDTASLGYSSGLCISNMLLGLMMLLVRTTR